MRVRTNLNVDEAEQARSLLLAAAVSCVVMDGAVLVRPDQLDQALAALTGGASTPPLERR